MMRLERRPPAELQSKALLMRARKSASFAAVGIGAFPLRGALDLRGALGNNPPCRMPEKCCCRNQRLTSKKARGLDVRILQWLAKDPDLEQLRQHPLCRNPKSQIRKLKVKVA